MSGARRGNLRSRRLKGPTRKPSTSVPLRSLRKLRSPHGLVGYRASPGESATDPRSRFTELIQAQDLSAWFLFTAALIAIGLGGLHALEPGHGKTIVAAYLVGSKGTAHHAILLGIIVTASHTAGVFALGAVTLYASRYIVPEQLYPWLGALSGITIAVLGGYMLLRRLTGAGTDHSHTPGSSHGHWKFWNRPAEDETDRNPAASITPSKQSVSLDPASC